MTGSDGETVFEVDKLAGTLTTCGDLDFRAEGRFKKACDELIESERPELFVDLAATRYICSSCLGMLFVLSDRAKACAKTLRVRVHKSTAPICELMGLGDLMKFEVAE